MEDEEAKEKLADLSQNTHYLSEWHDLKQKLKAKFNMEPTIQE
jgi:hypothetical protein